MMMRLAATLLLLAGATASAQQRRAGSPVPLIVSGTVIPFTPLYVAPVPGRCVPSTLLAGARVVALTVSEGGTDTAFIFAGEPQDVRTIEVAADETGPPLVVVTTAGYPTIWDLRGVPAARLRAVVVRSHSAQAVAGVSLATPLRFATPAGGFAECGGASRDRGAPAPPVEIEAMLLHRVDDARNAYDPVYFHLDRAEAVNLPTSPLRLTDLRGSAAIDVADVPPKMAGLLLLEERGAIRRATEADREAYEKAAIRMHSPEPAPQRHAWLVRRAITMPRGMYGGNSATFLIAPGVAQPIDAGSHNLYYRIDTATCTGGGCSYPVRPLPKTRSGQRSSRRSSR